MERFEADLHTSQHHLQPTSLQQINITGAYAVQHII